MHTTAQLLDLVKAAHGLTSDYKLAQVLGVSKANISNYRNGHRHPETEVCLRIAELAKLDPDVVVCSVQAERSTTEISRSHWASIAARLATPATALGAILSVAFLGAPAPADAVPIDGGADQPTAHVKAQKDTSWQVSTPHGLALTEIARCIARFFEPAQCLLGG